MICRHGLDENNCPVCQISINTRPFNSIKLDIIDNYSLKPINPFFKKYFGNENKSNKELIYNQNILKSDIMLNVPIPKTLGQIPNFKNSIFLEKLERVSINNFDKFGVSKKVPLTEKELNLEKNE